MIDRKSSSHAREIQDRVLAIRESLDVIEGNLCDWADNHYSETD